MRAPTVPEQLFGAVVLLTIAAAVILTSGGLLIGPPLVWQFAIPPTLGPLGFWLQTAWRMMRMQHRLAAAYNERIRQAQAASGGRAPTWVKSISNMGVTAEDMRRALGFEGQPASRPMREEQTE